MHERHSENSRTTPTRANTSCVFSVLVITDIVDQESPQILFFANRRLEYTTGIWTSWTPLGNVRTLRTNRLVGISRPRYVALDARIKRFDYRRIHAQLADVVIQFLLQRGANQLVFQVILQKQRTQSEQYAEQRTEAAGMKVRSGCEAYGDTASGSTRR